MSALRSSTLALALALVPCLWAGTGAPLAAAKGGAGAGAAGAAPARVVSVNLCTDQIAMMLAAPGQLVSVSKLAADPLASSMAAEAARFPQNRGSAEQVYLLHPDLVLAGEFTDPTTLDLLRRLGVRVVQVPVVTALDGVPAQLRAVAVAMGRDEEGETLVNDFTRGLAALETDLPPLAGAFYYPNGYTTGGGTVADDVLRHTGFFNIAGREGLTGGGFMPLERLVMAGPRLIVTSRPYAGASRSEEMLEHPALRALRASARVEATNDGDWLCGTPYILRAVAAMRAVRESLE